MKTLILAITTIMLGAALPAQDTKPTADAAAQPSWTSIAAMPGTCIVTGKALKPDKIVTFEAEGRTFQTCCKRCKGKVEKEPAKFAEKLDAAVIAAQTESYPLGTCPVSGKDLGKKPKNVVANGVLVRVCCGKCVKKVDAAPAKYAMAVQTAARDKQAQSYAMATCVVSGDDIDAADAVEVMYGTTLVRLCCEDCIDALKKTPAKYLTALETANKAAAKKADKGGDGADGANTSCCGAGGSCCSAKAEAKPAATTGGCCSEKAEAKPAKAKIQ